MGVFLLKYLPYLSLLFDQLKYGEHPPLPNSPFSFFPNTAYLTCYLLISNII